MGFEKEMDFWNVKDCNLFHCVFSFFLVHRIHKILLIKIKVWTMRYLNALMNDAELFVPMVRHFRQEASLIA